MHISVNNNNSVMDSGISLEHLLDASKTGFLILTAALDIKFHNAALRHMLKISDAENCSPEILDKLELSPAKFHRICRTVDNVGFWDGMYAMENSILNLHITRLPVIESSENEASEFLVEVYDCTREVMKIQKMTEQTVLAKETDTLHRQFLDQVSHEFKTPLHAIIGYSEFLKADSTITGDHRESVNEIITASSKLLDSINELLENSRSRSQKMSLSQEPVELAELFAECIELTKILAAKNKISVIPETTNISIYTDRVRLKQVLMNLLHNAIIYNRPGGLVQLRARELKGRCQIQVLDNGRGISPPDQDALFAAGGRFSTSGQGHSKTGLGLMICHKLVALMHGSLQVVSQKGMGSLFWFSLPLNRPQIVRPSDTKAGFARELLWIDSNEASRNLCTSLETLFPAIKCRFFRHAEAWQKAAKAPETLVIYRKSAGEEIPESLRQLPGYGKSGKKSGISLKQSRIVVVNDDGTIENHTRPDSDALEREPVFSLGTLIKMIEGGNS